MGKPRDPEIQRLQDDLKKRQRYTPLPKKLGEAVSSLMARTGYAQQLASSQLDETWLAVAGKQLAGSSRAGSIRRGVLEVTVKNSTVLQELTFQKKKLLQRLRATPDGASIGDLRFRVGSID